MKEYHTVCSADEPSERQFISLIAYHFDHFRWQDYFRSNL
jgi:hypothetical protein